MDEIKTVTFSQSKITHKLKVYLTLTLLIILVVILAIFFHSSGNNTPKSLSIPKDISSLQVAQYLAENGQYLAAQKQFQNMLVNANTSQSKIAIYYQETSLALKYKKYSDAMKYANKIKEANSNDLTYFVAEAQIFQSEGENSTSNKYWHQAIDHLNRQLPQYNLLVQEYQRDMASSQ